MRPTLKHVFLLAVFWSLASTSLAEEPYWAAKYPQFGGGRSPADLEELAHRFFEHTTLRKLSVDAKTLPAALEQVRTALREAHAEFGLGYTMSDSTYAGYSKPCHLRAKQIVLAAVIDRLAAQGGLRWDFSAAGALTFYPPRQQ